MTSASKIEGSSLQPLYRRKPGINIRKMLHGLLLLLLVAAVFVPFYMVILYAFKPANEINMNRLALTVNPTLDNFYQVIFKNDQFFIGYKNSIINTVPTVLILMGFTSMAAWVLARFNTRFYQAVYTILTLGLLIPFQCFVLPLFLNWYKLGLVSNNMGFILARAGLQISVSLVAVTGFVKTVPMEMEQAAGIDGCNRFQTFWKVVFPLMTPINVTQLVLNILFVWNDYPTAVILLRTKESRTLTLAQITYFSETGIMLNEAFAFFILTMIPILILYLSCQKYIVSGITAGAVKG